MENINQYKFGEFILDLKEKTLYKSSEIVPITPKPFALLKILVENQGSLVEKEELMSAVWKDSFVEECNLTFTIRQIRKILGDDFHHPVFIQTVPRRGYRFIAEVKQIYQRAETKEQFALQAKHQVVANASVTIGKVGNVLTVAEWQSQPKSEQIKNLDEKNHPHLFLVQSDTKLLFGRGKEIDETEKLLLQNEIRLLTLTGAGGTGKTSLAKKVAGDLGESFSDGVFFVELASVFNPELIIPAIAQTLNVKETTEKNLKESLRTFLSDREILLILDNFEQIVSAGSLISELLLASRKLKILITSRVSLNLGIENELFVPTLDFPDSDLNEISAEKIKKYPAVELFVERARGIKSGFVLTDENAPAIAGICARLDGLPLAIELAAARIKLLNPEDILQRLNLDLLSGKAQDIPARQRTMRNTIAWSYDLLDEKEKTLFNHLAIFSGGFTVEAAETVCGEENKIEILDGLESLTDCNLLKQSEDETGKIRLFFLETIREFSVEKLTENSGEEAVWRKRHLLYYLDFAKRMERNFMGTEQVFSLNQMESERDNFRAALDWSRKNESETELKLASTLAQFWTFRGYLSEGIKCLTESLARNPNAPPSLQAKALVMLGQLIWVKGDYVKAIAVCDESLRIARKINYSIIAALSLFYLGMSHWYHYGDSKLSIQYLEEGSNLYRELKFDSGVVYTLVVLAAIYQTNGNLSQAEQILEESLAAAKRTNNNLALSIAMVNYGRLEIAKGNLTEAKSFCQESLRLRGELADRWGLVQCLEPLAAVALKEGNAEKAAKILGAIDLLLESLGATPPLILREDHEPNIKATRAALDKGAFDKCFTDGRKLSLQEVVKLALE